jgi:hypothetical protein
MRGGLVTLALGISIGLPPTSGPNHAQSIRRLLYVALPGVAAEVEHGGVGVLVFDIDRQ